MKLIIDTDPGTDDAIAIMVAEGQGRLPDLLLGRVAVKWPAVLQCWPPQAFSLRV